MREPRAPDSTAATAATEQFNYMALFPHLAKRKPPPTRRLFMSEQQVGWKVEEVLVQRNEPEKLGSSPKRPKSIKIMVFHRYVSVFCDMSMDFRPQSRPESTC